jgi:pyruvate formate lyase activating enzyme
MPQSSDGLVFDIQRFCLHDGPGIRTTLFLKGCNLRCEWCCNPESQSSSMQVLYDAARCIGCGRCVRACPHDAIIAPPAAARIDRTRCHLTGACTAVCPTGALRTAGAWMSVEQALGAALRDRPYYDVSGGGITLSGGEPLRQAAFAGALLTAAKREGVHTTVETAGCVAWESFEAVNAATDLFLFDIKHADDKRHREGTGEGNALILQNLRRLADAGATLVVRHVLVPGYNMDDRSLNALANLTRELELTHLQLLAFHRLGIAKYAQLARRSDWCSTAPADAERVRDVHDYLSSLVDCDVGVG